MRWIVPFLIAIAPAQALRAQMLDTSPDARLSYIIFSGDGHNSSMGSGEVVDWRRAQLLSAGTPMLYVQQNGAAYVIRDAATVRQAQAILAPQQELGRQQRALGRQQGALGRQQAALGRQQARVGRLHAIAAPARQADIGRSQSSIGRQQAELGRQQAELGRQQGVLGREQARLAKLAGPQIRALIADAMRRGLAQRVD